MKTVPLAAEHKGMKVCYRGLLSQSREALEGEQPGLVFMLEQLEKHLHQLGKRWYAGDQTVVDEFLQLYCIEKEARKAIKQAINGAQPCTPSPKPN